MLYAVRFGLVAAPLFLVVLVGAAHAQTGEIYVGEVRELEVGQVREIDKQPPVELMANGRQFDDIELQKRVAADGSVVGVVANRSDAPIRDVKLLVDHVWHWANEMKPGTDNPGRARYVTISETVPPGKAVEFRYDPLPPLPVRGDGHFSTTIQIASLERITYEVVPRDNPDDPSPLP